MKKEEKRNKRLGSGVGDEVKVPSPTAEVSSEAIEDALTPTDRATATASDEGVALATEDTVAEAKLSDTDSVSADGETDGVSVDGETESDATVNAENGDGVVTDGEFSFDTPVFDMTALDVVEIADDGAAELFPVDEVAEEAKTEAEADAEVDAEAEAEAEAESEADAEAEAEAETEVGIDESTADDEAKVDTEAEAEAVVDEAETGEVDEPDGVSEGDELTEDTDGEKSDEDRGEGEATTEDRTEEARSVASKKEKKENESRRIDGIFDFIELFVFTLAVVLLLTSFVLRHSVVEGDSMLGTLHSGETLIISDLFYEPKAGDIVVVDDHSTALKKPIIKRVIAVGGDTVRVTKVGIAVNGELLDEPYVFIDNEAYTYDVYPSEEYFDNATLKVEVGVYYEFVVPDGELFVLGDHRNKSTDSRAIGTVDVDAVVGRVLFRILPFDAFGKVD